MPSSTVDASNGALLISEFLCWSRDRRSSAARRMRDFGPVSACFVFGRRTSICHTFLASRHSEQRAVAARPPAGRVPDDPVPALRRRRIQTGSIRNLGIRRSCWIRRRHPRSDNWRRITSPIRSYCPAMKRTVQAAVRNFLYITLFHHQKP